MAFIDITGQKFNRLTVIKRVENDKHNKAQWLCLCECGKEIIARGTDIRKGKIKSCGCLKKDIARSKFVDLTGRRFGRWTVLKHEATNNKKTMFLCRCDCGTERLVPSQDLQNGSSQSCGCLRSELTSERMAADLTNQRFGKLIAIESVGSDQHRKRIWKCQCDCGNVIYAEASSLISGNSASCGCLKSKGEYYISQALQKLQIPYEIQKTFKDLKSDKDNFLKFDFYLPQYNLCIEFQGEQHYKIIPLFGERKFNETQKYDNKKREYCKVNNINLIEVPYTDRQKIDENYIKNLLKNYVPDWEE